MLNLHRRFPLYVAVGALVVYSLTLSHGVTLNSLTLAAKVAGWDETPSVGQPLLWLLTLPLRLLPAGWIPAALNLFAAATAAVTLGLLVRTIPLLPWDRPWKNENQASRWPGTLPVLLAVGLCGLQFSFWQEATAATGEMLDLLLLAAALWLLLEYRVRQESRWLNAAAVVWGLGMAENWLMLLALPLFLAGVIWLKGLKFFQLKFLRGWAGLGLAGFSIYALLPVVNGLAPHSPWNLGQAWLVSLKQTKYLLALLYHQFWVSHRLLTLVVGVSFLVPLLPCLVRHPDKDTQNRPLWEQLEIWIYRSLRLLLLLACLWLAFDPVIGPQQIARRQFGIGLPLLTLTYLNALGAAFLAGNFLLLASPTPVQRQLRSLSKIPSRQLAVPCATGCLIMVIVGLAGRNAPAILHLKFHPVQRFGELLTASLPGDGGVILSEHPQKLAVFQAALAHHRNGSDWVAVDTRALPMVEYRAGLERHHPAGWLTAATRHELTPAETLRLLEQIARTNRLFYLHPSYGIFFERFCLEPSGAVYAMKLRENHSPEMPPLPAPTLAANEVFWNTAWQKELAPLVAAPEQRPTGWQKIIQHLGLTAAPVYQDRQLAEWYSLSLDGWGVALQRQGRWNEARLRLEQARQLNPDNLSARISLNCNTNLQAGVKLELTETEKVISQLGNVERLHLILNNGGPFDGPVFCYLLGGVFQKTGMLLQAVEQFERTCTLAPGVLAPEIALVELYTRLQFPARARRLLDQLHTETQKRPADIVLNLEMALLEAQFWLAQTNIANARSALQSVLMHYPDDAQIANGVLKAYLAFGDITNALRLVNLQLSKAPDDAPSLNTQAALLIQSGNAPAAIPVLDHLLTLTNLPAARLNHAIARLACREFDAAEADYRELEKTGAEAAGVCYGLALISDHRHATNQAVYYLQRCLTNTPAGTALWREASTRLQTLQAVRAK